MKKQLSSLLTVVMLTVVSSGVWANAMPDVVVETTITELIDELQARRPELEQDKLGRRRLYEQLGRRLDETVT